MPPVVWEQWPDGPRCYLRTPAGRIRVHHGLAGMGLAAVGVGRRGLVGLALIGAGAFLVAHDWHDRYWLHD